MESTSWSVYAAAELNRQADQWALKEETCNHFTACGSSSHHLLFTPQTSTQFHKSDSIVAFIWDVDIKDWESLFVLFRADFHYWAGLEWAWSYPEGYF